jgi:ABC-type Fe3+-siderophore transport system permease subunit
MWWFIALFWLALIMFIAAAAGGELLYIYAERRRWRFSLRTLLIATTLVAAVLGLIVSILKWPTG